MLATILLFGILLLNGLILFFVFRSQAGSGSGEVLQRIKQLEERLERTVRDEMAVSRNETNETNRRTRQEMTDFIGKFGDSMRREIVTLSEIQKHSFEKFSERLGDLIDRNEAKINEVRKAVEQRLESIQKDNGEKLEKMRETVDEKLHATLEKRLGESFKMVGNQLESVQKGLGEMQMLATGVGDLKKVLQNVKTRGTWGEVQLENILQDIFVPSQYVKNAITKKGSNDRVEFAIRMPGRENKEMFLPIDAKFPLEDYQGLIDASERGDVVSIERFSKALEMRVKAEAKDVMTKYLDPPYTTEYGIIFFPNEGLYAEVLRRPGLFDTLQKDFHVIIAGPTTIVAILFGLQTGFKTLALDKRASEIGAVLERVKKEFSTFGDLLDKTHKKLREASNTIETASKKSRTIEKQLGKVQEIPETVDPVKDILLIDEGINESKA